MMLRLVACVLFFVVVLAPVAEALGGTGHSGAQSAPASQPAAKAPAGPRAVAAGHGRAAARTGPPARFRFRGSCWGSAR